jgi:MYXO-CTERM domain-containing protein
MRTKLMLMLIPVLAGCYHPGEAGYLGFDFPNFGDFLAEFRSGDQLLLGTRLCPEIAEVLHDDGEHQILYDTQRDEFRACFDEVVSGPASLDADGCLEFQGAGEVTWELTPNSCGDQSERMRFTVIEPTPDLQLGLDEWRLRLLQEPVFDADPIGLAPGRDIAELQESSSEPRRVLAGQLDVPLMRFDNANGRVYWMSEDVGFELVGDGLEPYVPGDTGSFEDWASTGALPLRMNPGSSGRVRATLPGGQVVESPELIAVSQDAAVSLDLIAVDRYLFADVRDAEGHIIHAAPIEWSLAEGAMAVTPGSLNNELLTAEYAMFHHGRCEEPPSTEPEVRHAVVRARLGELEDTVEVEYVVDPPESDFSLGADADCLYADAPADDETGPDGCACSTEERAPTAPLLLAAGMLALLRRRRASESMG